MDQYGARDPALEAGRLLLVVWASGESAVEVSLPLAWGGGEPDPGPVTSCGSRLLLRLVDIVQLVAQKVASGSLSSIGCLER